ncbi:MAG: hypothetical protein J0M11_15900 [Anaerolineae bacterium]|nr:hypothetical protein [Anaerolineae bacterium]
MNFSLIEIILWMSTVIFGVAVTGLVYLLMPFKSQWGKGVIGILIGGAAFIAALFTQGYLACTFPIFILAIAGKLNADRQPKPQPHISKDPEPAQRLEVKQQTKAKYARVTTTGEEKVLVESVLYKVAKGSSVVVKYSRMIENTIEVEVGSGFAPEAGLNISVLHASVKAHIEGKIKKTFSEQQSVEEQIELRGDISEIYQVSWYQVWRIGHLEAHPSDTPIKIPFRYFDKMYREVIEIR